MRLAGSDRDSDAAFEADVGLAADLRLGMLARAPKLVGSTLLSHELALSARARTFDAEKAQRSDGLVSRVAPDSRAEVVLAVEVVVGEPRCRCVD